MKYATEYIEAPNPEALAVEMNGFYKNLWDKYDDFSLRDVSYLSKADPDPFNPQKLRVSFIALVTYKIIIHE